MEKINEIKIPKGVDRIAVKQHDNKIVIELIPEEPKFKRGDILISIATPGLTVIFDKVTSTIAFDSIYNDGENSNHGWRLKSFRHATKEEKQEFFDELKADGKWWNAETKCIEGIPKFKRGDFIFEGGRIMIVKNYPNNYYALIYPKLDMKPIYNGRYAPTMPLSLLSFRYATEDEKQLLIDAMKKNGKRWNADKKCIENIPQPRFKIGDKVRIKRGVSTGTSMCDGLTLTVNRYHNLYQNVLYCKGSPYLFNEGWLEPYVEELKKGDLAIFWEDIISYAAIKIYDRKAHNGHCDISGLLWKNAIKFESKEQFEKILRGEI